MMMYQLFTTNRIKSVTVEHTQQRYSQICTLLLGRACCSVPLHQNSRVYSNSHDEFKHLRFLLKHTSVVNLTVASENVVKIVQIVDGWVRCRAV